MKNITVAIDFDEELDHIVEFAAKLFKEKNATLHVVHVYQSEAALLDFDPKLVNQLEEYEKHLQKEANAVRQAVQNLSKLGIQAHGYMKPVQRDVAAALLDFASHRNSDLIIMGTHHPGMVERMVVGSVAESVIRQAPVPVIVVPKPAKE